MSATIPGLDTRRRGFRREERVPFGWKSEHDSRPHLFDAQISSALVDASSFR
jgi:hypothetical protein